MRLLVLTHTFPPSRHANAKRPGYLVRSLLEAGWQVDVFTTSIGVPADEAESLTHAGLRIVRSSLHAERWLAKCSGHKRLYRAVGLFLAGTSWPDICYKWVLGAMSESRKLGPYDRVLAFVMPASMLLTGLYRRGVGRCWTFDYQESLSPHLRQHARRSPLQRAMRPALEKLERHTLHKAGQVVFTAETNRRAYVEGGLVPESSTHHVPYFFDTEQFNTPAPSRSPDFEVVYFGTFDWRGARSPETFLRSLALFLKSNPAARPRTRFSFYGNWLHEHDAFVSDLGLQDVVSINSSVPYSEYIEKVRSSPVLLLVVAAAHNLFMPSKIVDYFGAKRPILAFVPKKSEMAGVLNQAGMGEYACEEFDAEGGCRALRELWSRYSCGRLEVDSSKACFWSSKVQVERYVKLLGAIPEVV